MRERQVRGEDRVDPKEVLGEGSPYHWCPTVPDTAQREGAVGGQLHAAT